MFLRSSGWGEDHTRLFSGWLYRLRQDGHLFKGRRNVRPSNDREMSVSGGLLLYWRLLICSYVLTLITDGMRSVRAFHFDKAAASVLTTCVSTLPPRWCACVFLLNILSGCQCCQQTWRCANACVHFYVEYCGCSFQVKLKWTLMDWCFFQMVTMEPGYLFLGSRLGNSLLLKYTEKLQEIPLEEGKDKQEMEKDKDMDKQVCPGLCHFCS